jgi:hypothetical protein
MSEDHEHEAMRYTIVMQSTWGRQEKLVLVGTGSSLRDGELLIMGKHGEFHSINYSRVRWMRAEPIGE